MRSVSSWLCSPVYCLLSQSVKKVNWLIVRALWAPPAKTLHQLSSGYYWWPCSGSEEGKGESTRSKTGFKIGVYVTLFSNAKSNFKLWGMESREGTFRVMWYRPFIKGVRGRRDQYEHQLHTMWFIITLLLLSFMVITEALVWISEFLEIQGEKWFSSLRW